MSQSKFLLVIYVIMLFAACKESEGGTMQGDSDRADDVFVPTRSVPAFEPIDLKLLNDETPIVPNEKIVNDFFNELKTKAYLTNEIPDTSYQIQRLNYPLIIGKLNSDNTLDVLIPITFRKINPNNLSKKHPFLFENYYIIALNDGEKLLPAELFYSGNDEAELLIQFRSVNDSGWVIGKQIPNTFNKYPDEFDIKYSMQKGEMRAR